MVRDKIDDIKGLIAMLGGPTEAAKWAGIRPSGVSNWAKRGVPTSYHLRLIAYAEKKGIEIAPSVFGLDEDWSCDVGRESIDAVREFMSDASDRAA